MKCKQEHYPWVKRYCAHYIHAHQVCEKEEWVNILHIYIQTSLCIAWCRLEWNLCTVLYVISDLCQDSKTKTTEWWPAFLVSQSTKWFSYKGNISIVLIIHSAIVDMGIMCRVMLVVCLNNRHFQLFWLFHFVCLSLWLWPCFLFSELTGFCSDNLMRAAKFFFVCDFFL